MLRKNCIKASAKDDDDDGHDDGDDVTANGGNAQELPERERHEREQRGRGERAASQRLWLTKKNVFVSKLNTRVYR